MNNPLTPAQLASAIQVRRYAMEREIIARQGQSVPAEAPLGDSLQAQGMTHDDPAADDAGTSPT
jgi:hypothetical protein